MDGVLQEFLSPLLVFWSLYWELCYIAGIWLAAVTIMIYIYGLADTDFVIKVIGFIPTIALAFWVSFKFWK